MKSKRIYTLAQIGVFVSVLAVVSQISIPMPFLVPITLQVLAVSLTAFLLGTKKSLTALLVYVALGLAGVPVFACFGGGVSTLFGYTGGFIWGFFPLAFFCAIGNGKIKILFSSIGLTACHLIGVLWYSMLAKIDILTSFLTMSLPYVFKDALLVVISYFIAKLINKRIKKS